MPTYADMRARIADELANDGDISTAQINYAIQDSIKLYERREWWFNTRLVTFVTSANGEYYVSSPTSTFDDMIDVLSMVITNNGVKSPMYAVDSSEIDTVQTGTVLGVPRKYARISQKVRLFPIADAEYTIELAYTYKLDALVNDSDENAWTDEAEELIRQSAKRRIALNYLQADDLAARFATLEREAYTAMLAENRMRHPNTILRPEAMLGKSYFNINSGW